MTLPWQFTCLINMSDENIGYQLEIYCPISIFIRTRPSDSSDPSDNSDIDHELDYWNSWKDFHPYHSTFGNAANGTVCTYCVRSCLTADKLTPCWVSIDKV